MVFKEPRTATEVINREEQRDALMEAARVLDDCKVEPNIAAKLRVLAMQVDDALRAAVERMAE